MKWNENKNLLLYILREILKYQFQFSIKCLLIHTQNGRGVLNNREWTACWCGTKLSYMQIVQNEKCVSVLHIWYATFTFCYSFAGNSFYSRNVSNWNCRSCDTFINTSRHCHQPSDPNDGTICTQIGRIC